MTTIKAHELVEGMEVQRYTVDHRYDPPRPKWVLAIANKVVPHPGITLNGRTGVLVTWSDNGRETAYGPNDEFLVDGAEPTAYRRQQLAPADWREYRNMGDTRNEIALLLWAIVAEFTGDDRPLIVAAGQDDWLRAEEYIRERAAAAEQQTIEFDGETEVIMAVLNELALADDYWRIKRNEQHMAFEEGNDD